MKDMRIDDAMLDSSEQQFVRDAVKSLSEDSLSLSWRSALNERLLQESAARRKRERFLWFLKPAFGLGLAGALALVTVIGLSVPRPSASSHGSMTSSRVEAAIVSDYRQSAAVTDIVGSGLNPLESTPTSTDNPDLGLEDSDLDSL
jgi:hypothetical protein